MKLFWWLVAVAVIAAYLQSASAAEKDFQNPWCDQHNGISEYVLPDNARVDCLTSTHAVEHDFARKWAECIGQALFYGAVTGRRPGCVLILESVKDQRYVNRYNKVMEEWKLPVDVWFMYDMPPPEEGETQEQGL